MSLARLLRLGRRPSPFLLVLSAPSGGGKTTVALRVLRRLKWMRRCVTATTRAPRPGERQGRDYRFLAPEEFARRAAAGGFYEHARVHGHDYGTPAREVEAALARGRSLLLVIDVQGGAAVKARRPDSVLVFLAPPSLSELRSRLRKRATDSPSDLRRRLRGAARECAAGERYDYLVINDDLDSAVEAVSEICRASRRRLPSQDGRKNPAP